MDPKIQNLFIEKIADLLSNHFESENTYFPLSLKKNHLIEEIIFLNEKIIEINIVNKNKDIKIYIFLEISWLAMSVEIIRWNTKMSYIVFESIGSFARLFRSFKLNKSK